MRFRDPMKAARPLGTARARPSSRSGLFALGLTPILAACAGSRPPTVYPTSWSLRSDRAFVRERTGEVRQPRELLESGRALAAEGRTDEAIDAFRSLYQSGVDHELKAKALLEEARAWKDAGRRIEAHESYLRLLDRYGASPLIPDALREAFDNGFALADSSSAAGLQAVRDLLTRFPREDISAECAFRLGEFYYRRDDMESAIAEFESVRLEYARTRWAEAALLRIGLGYLLRFKGISYDPRPLADARQRFEKFLEDFPNSSLASEARQRLAEVKALQAEKDYDVADYYRQRRRYPAARAMYAAVVKDFPGTPAAEEAARNLEALPPPPNPAEEAPP